MKASDDEMLEQAEFCKKTNEQTSVRHENK